jgi:hypothetical protein
MAERGCRRPPLADKLGPLRHHRHENKPRRKLDQPDLASTQGGAKHQGNLSTAAVERHFWVNRIHPDPVLGARTAAAQVETVRYEIADDGKKLKLTTAGGTMVFEQRDRH